MGRSYRIYDGGAYFRGNGRVEGFSPAETTIVWALMCRRRVFKEDLMEDLWPHPDFMPETWGDIIRVQIFRVRHKLKILGWKVTLAYGYGNGWRLEKIS